MFQIKKSIIILFAVVLMSEFTNANSNSRYQIIIDISEQRLYLFEKEILKQSFPVSTSSFGEGSIENSFKTPLGLHQIKSKIGTNVITQWRKIYPQKNCKTWLRNDFRKDTEC